MMKIGNRILRAAFGVLLVFAVFAAAPSASAATPIELTIPADAKEFTVDIHMNESRAFGSAEFGLTAEGAELKSVRYTKGDALGGAVSVIPDESGVSFVDGRYLFGFANISNSYSGSVDAGKLTFGYEDDAPLTLRLSHMKLVYLTYLAADGKYAEVESDLRDYDHFVIRVVRAGAGGDSGDPDNPDNPSKPGNPSNPGATPGGGGGSGSGGGAPSTAVTVEIGEDSTPLAAGNEGRSAYFDDVAAGYAWACKEIDALYARGVVKGVAARMFDPASNITRGDFVLLFVRAFGLEAAFTDNFDDVPPGKYYYEAIGIAKALGVAEGYSATEFRPDAYISRQETAALIYRAMNVIGKPFEEGAEADTAAFADGESVAEYAASAVRALIRAGVIKGDGGNINPRGFTTRAETAVMIYRLTDGN